MATETTSVQPGEPGPRERMVRSAMALMCVQGVSGTGLRMVVEHAGAPRGSLQHYFPGGKDQLVREALELAGRRAARTARPRHEELAKPSDVLAATVEAWRGWLTDTDYALGCPAVATVADVAASSGDLREAVGETFRVWQAAVEDALVEAGVPAGRAPALAVVLISAVEGAIVLSRARRTTAPLDAVLTELAPLLDGVR